MNVCVLPNGQAIELDILGESRYQETMKEIARHNEAQERECDPRLLRLRDDARSFAFARMEVHTKRARTLAAMNSEQRDS
jgi:hypothetical protein